MSLILEALRKSEAERRRGQVPNLHAELPPVAPSARSRQPAWPWLLALAVIAMVATTWLARGWWAPVPPAAEPSGPARPTTDRAAPTRVDSSVADTARADAVVPPADIRPQVTAPRDISTPVADAGAAVEAPTRPATDPAPRQRPEPAAPPARGSGSGSDRPTAPVATAPPPTALPAPPTASPTARPTDATPPTATATVDAPSPLQLSDLAAVERRALPPLKVSMHMWAPTSARRFAIIDGARVNEGDRLGDAVVDEITRDGVVLAWRGQHVHIPIH